MPIFNTPITTDDNSLPKILNQPLPVVLYLYDSRQAPNRALDTAITTAAKEQAGQVLIARVDTTANPQTRQQYGSLTMPAVVTLLKEGSDRTMKSQAANITPADVPAHINFLLGKGPAPTKSASVPPKAAASNGAHAAPQVVTDATFEKEVLGSKEPVLVDFWAAWCAPCRTIAPAVEKAAQTYAGRARVVKVNVDENPALAQRFQVMSIPTLIVFKNGQAVKRQVGANPAIIPSLIEDALR